MAKVIGAAIKRREDPNLVTGKGKYTDDLQLPNMTYAAVVRSPYAHARIKSIDTSQAKAIPGVIAVFTGQDAKDSGAPGAIPVGWLHPGIKTPEHRMLAVDTVRYVGHGVAVVVAEDRYTARDAAELVEVDYEALPAVSDAAKAAEAGAPLVFPELGDNIAFDWQLGDKAKTDQAFANAAHTVTLNLRNNRLIPHAIEPRSALADYNSVKGELTLWMTTQNPHIHRLLMSLASVGLPEHKIRVIAPEVGGGLPGLSNERQFVTRVGEEERGSPATAGQQQPRPNTAGQQAEFDHEPGEGQRGEQPAQFGPVAVGDNQAGGEGEVGEEGEGPEAQRKR